MHKLITTCSSTDMPWKENEKMPVLWVIGIKII